MLHGLLQVITIPGVDIKLSVFFLKPGNISEEFLQIYQIVSGKH